MEVRHLGIDTIRACFVPIVTFNLSFSYMLFTNLDNILLIAYGVIINTGIYVAHNRITLKSFIFLRFNYYYIKVNFLDHDQEETINELGRFVILRNVHGITSYVLFKDKSDAVLLKLAI